MHESSIGDLSAVETQDREACQAMQVLQADIGDGLSVLVVTLSVLVVTEFVHRLRSASRDIAIIAIQNSFDSFADIQMREGD